MIKLIKTIIVFIGLKIWELFYVFTILPVKTIIGWIRRKGFGGNGADFWTLLIIALLKMPIYIKLPIFENDAKVWGILLVCFVFSILIMVIIILVIVLSTIIFKALKKLAKDNWEKAKKIVDKV